MLKHLDVSMDCREGKQCKAQQNRYRIIYRMYDIYHCHVADLQALWCFERLHIMNYAKTAPRGVMHGCIGVMFKKLYFWYGY